jgi:predicted transcriptional regulator
MLTDDDLNAADREVLQLLRNGRVTPGFAANELDRDRTYLSQRLKRLLEHGHVERLARGLYELHDDPREATDE